MSFSSIQVSYEKPIDSAEDILTLDRRLFLPYGTPFIKMFATSPLKVQQEIYATTEANKQVTYEDINYTLI